MENKNISKSAFKSFWKEVLNHFLFYKKKFTDELNSIQDDESGQAPEQKLNEYGEEVNKLWEKLMYFEVVIVDQIEVMRFVLNDARTISLVTNIWVLFAVDHKRIWAQHVRIGDHFCWDDSKFFQSNQRSWKHTVWAFARALSDHVGKGC